MTRVKEILLVSGTFITVLLFGGGGWYKLTHPFEDSQPNITASFSSSANTARSYRSPPHKNETVTVYFSKHPESDDDPNLTFPVRREVESGDVENTALSSLLAGPTTSEANRGYFSSVQLKVTGNGCEQKDFIFTVKNTEAVLVLCRPFDHAGTETDAQAVSSLKTTMSQFESIDRVSVLDTAGNCVFTSPAPQLCAQK